LKYMTCAPSELLIFLLFVRNWKNIAGLGFYEWVLQTY
jgi:hypothetical protein